MNDQSKLAKTGKLVKLNWLVTVTDYRAGVRP